MKLELLLLRFAIICAVAALLGLAVDIVPLALFACSIGALFSLVVASDYTHSTRRTRAARALIAAHRCEIRPLAA